VSVIIQELTRLLEIKERLLRISLEEGTILERDDPEFLEHFQNVITLAENVQDRKRKEMARRILGHIRQFNPFNSSDTDENEMLEEVIEDFIYFSREQIQKLSGHFSE
jgi:hypothetical protein